MKTTVSLLLVALVALLPACGNNSNRTNEPPAPPPSNTATNADGTVRGGLGNESDIGKRSDFGRGKVTEATIGCYGDAYKNLIRALLVSDPESGDVDTLEARLRDGEKVFEISSGTSVKFLDGAYKIVRMPDGVGYNFWRVEVLDGPHAGKKVRIYAEHLSGAPPVKGD